MLDSFDRRSFLQSAALAATGLLTSRLAADDQAPLYKISLAQWSLHQALFSKKLDNLDFARVTREEFDIDGVEYVNQFFMDKAKDAAYLADMKKRAEDHGVRSLLIMCDGEGRLGDPNDEERKKSVEKHHKWVEAAAVLGCHSIRVNAASEGSFEEQQKLAADGLRQLTEFAEPHNLSVIVENHGGLSSNGEWLAGVMKLVDHPHCGTLPDFGNFHIGNDEWYDRYEGVEELMPFAHAVSAKSYDFDPARPLVTVDMRNGKETNYLKMMRIVLKAGYSGFVGIEYEGTKADEYTGIRQTKQLLVTVRDALAGLI